MTGGKTMQGVELLDSSSHLLRQSGTTIDLPQVSRNLYSIVQQEVDLGAQALKRESAEIAVTLFQSALQKLTVDQPFYDHLVHNLLLSYELLIKKLLKQGDTATALDFLRAALRLEIRGDMAEDATFLRRFAGAFESLGIAFFQNNLIKESLLCYRKAISVYPAPGSYVNLTNSLAATGQRARLSDFTTEITPEQLGRHLFIACVPKSASTFLKNLLVNVTGYRDLFTVYAAGQSEHELYLPTLRESAHLDTVTQQHCRASDANVHLMQAFGIRPVVLVRNIFDSVMSLLDFYNQGAFQNSYFRADWPALDEETKIDLLIENVIPWYFQFVASWTWLTSSNGSKSIGSVTKTLSPTNLRAFSRCLSFTASAQRGEASRKGLRKSKRKNERYASTKESRDEAEQVLTISKRSRSAA